MDCQEIETNKQKRKTKKNTEIKKNMTNTPLPSQLYLCQFQDINLMRRSIPHVSQARFCDLTMTIAL